MIVGRDARCVRNAEAYMPLELKNATGVLIAMNVRRITQQGTSNE